jgi:hypothetical protein
MNKIEHILSIRWRTCRLLPVAMPLDDWKPCPKYGTIKAEDEGYQALRARLEKSTRDGFAMMLGK